MNSTRARSWTPLIVIAMMIIGGWLAIAWPIWIAPPNTSSTTWPYIGALLLWFPVLLIVFALQERRSKSVFFLLLVAGILMTFVVLGLTGPNLSAWGIEAKNCTSSEVSPGQTEYVCTVPGIFNHQIFTLQGPTGSPLAHLVSNKTVFTQ